MLKSLVIVSVFSSAVWAQSTTSFPPSGISDSCSTFLKAFNSDSSLNGCTSSIISATSAFTNPGSKPSKAAITTALDTISSSDACSESAIRSKLTDFYAACTAELTSKPNQDVIITYDVLYSICPYKRALTSKDDDDKTYCVLKTTSENTSADTQKYLVIQDGGAGQSAGRPNATTFENEHLLFLNLNEDMPPETLCTSCTRSVLTSYITWGSNINYAPGLSSSELLSGQSKLYAGVQKTCGQNFLSGAVQAAGGLAGNPLFNHNGAMASGARLEGAITALLGSAAAALFALL